MNIFYVLWLKLIEFISGEHLIPGAAPFKAPGNIRRGKGKVGSLHIVWEVGIQFLQRRLNGDNFIHMIVLNFNEKCHKFFFNDLVLYFQFRSVFEIWCFQCVVLCYLQPLSPEEQNGWGIGYIVEWRLPRQDTRTENMWEKVSYYLRISQSLSYG